MPDTLFTLLVDKAESIAKSQGHVMREDLPGCTLADWRRVYTALQQRGPIVTHVVAFLDPTSTKSPVKARVLYLLGQHPRGLSASIIASLCDSSLSTVTQALERLSRKQMTRKNGHRWTITRRGRAHRPEVSPNYPAREAYPADIQEACRTISRMHCGRGPIRESLYQEAVGLSATKIATVMGILAREGKFAPNCAVNRTRWTRIDEMATDAPEGV